MRVKRIDLPLVRFRPTDPEGAQRRRMNNVPVLLKKGEPRRTGWRDLDVCRTRSLDKIMTRLNDARFLRVHRGAILNANFVQELLHESDRKYVALLAGIAGTRIPIGRESSMN